MYLSKHVSVDKRQYFLWIIANLFILASVKLFVIQCGMNKLEYYGTHIITKANLSIGKNLLEKSPVFKIDLTGTLPRDKNKLKNELS